MCTDYIIKIINEYDKDLEATKDQRKTDPALQAEYKNRLGVLISNFLIVYIQLTNEKWEYEVVKFLYTHWGSIMQKQYHTYQFLRYLNDYKYLIE